MSDNSKKLKVIAKNSSRKQTFQIADQDIKNAPKEADKLERLLQVKRRQKEEAMHIEDTQRLATEIEMLKVVMHLVSRGEEIEKGKKKERGG
jgi:hypothetical protein